jgi:hypothetical protein
VLGNLFRTLLIFKERLVKKTDYLAKHAKKSQLSQKIEKCKTNKKKPLRTLRLCERYVFYLSFKLAAR